MQNPGDILAAKFLLKRAACFIRDGEPVPEPLNGYLVDCLLSICEGRSPENVLHLVGTSGAQNKASKHFTIAVRCLILIRNGLTPGDAQKKLAAEYRCAKSTIKDNVTDHREAAQKYITAMEKDFDQIPTDPLLFE